MPGRSNDTKEERPPIGFDRHPRVRHHHFCRCRRRDDGLDIHHRTRGIAYDKYVGQIFMAPRVGQGQRRLVVHTQARVKTSMAFVFGNNNLSSKREIASL